MADTITSSNAAGASPMPALEESHTSLMEGFAYRRIKTRGAEINVATAGSGPPLLLIHGNPLTHVSWHRIAPTLAKSFSVVAIDLRGYGDSSLPDPGPNHINYSSSVLAGDMFDVMDSLGHQRFFLAGHDRGARVSHRMCLDQPDRIMKVCILDVLP